MFTKFPEDITINGQLWNIKNSTSKDPKTNEDESFKLIINKMLEKTKDAKNFNPLTEEPMDLIKKLKISECIKNPRACFKFALNSNSKATIQKHTSMLQLSIQSAIKREEYLFIKYKLDELVYLKDNLKDGSMEQVYKECITEILNHVSKKYEETKELINSYLSRQNSLSNEDVEKYQETVNNFKELKCFEDYESLRGKIMSSESLVTNLKSKIEELINNIFEKEDCISRNNINSFSNIKLLVSYFPQLGSLYDEIKKQFIDKAENIVKEVENNLNKKELEKVVEQVNSLISSNELYKEHIDIGHIIEKSVSFIIDHFKNIFQVAEKTLKNTSLEKDHVKRIENCFEEIERAKNILNFKNYLKDDLKNIYDNLVKITYEYFQKLDKEANSFLNENKSPKELEPIIEGMKSIRLIQAIEFKSSEEYNKTIQTLIGKISLTEQNVSQYLENLKNNENVDYDRIFSSLNYLRGAEWIKKENRINYDEIISNVKMKIYENLLKLKNKIIELDLQLSKYENLEIANNYLLQFTYANNKLELIMTEIKELKESSVKIFNDAVENQLDIIKNKFNLESHLLLYQLKELEKVKKDYNSFHPSIMFLKEIQIVDFDDMNKKIETAQREISDIENEISKLKSREDKLKEFHQLLAAKKSDERKKILNKKNFKDMNQLDEEELKVGEEIKTKMKLLEKQKDELKSLTSNKTKYEEYMKSPTDSSEDARNFIVKTKYKSIENLDIEINNINKELKNGRFKSDYVFGRIDLGTTENSLIYLKKCCSIIFIREKANTAKTNLENYLREYGRYIEAESKFLLSEIEGFKHDETSSAFGYAERLKSRMTELIDIKNFKSLDEFISSSMIYQELVSKLDKNLLYLSTRLHNDSADHKDLSNNLEKVRSLSLLDNFVDGKYFKLYLQYQVVATTETKEFHKKILEFINKNDYMSLSTELVTIEESPIKHNLNVINQIKRLLTQSIYELISRVGAEAVLIPNTLEPKAFQDIIENLKKLENAQKYFCVIPVGNNNQPKLETSFYIDAETQKSLSDGISDIENIISTKLMSFLDSINALINFDDFSEAEKQKEHLEQIRYLLGNHCRNKDMEIRQKIENLQIKLGEIADNVSTRYDKMPLKDYMDHPPTRIFEKLANVANRNQKYNDALRKITKTITETLNNSLTAAKGANPDERNKYLLTIQEVLGILPKEIRERITQDLNEFKTFLSQKEGNYNEDYKRIFKEFELKSVEKFMNKCREDGMNNIVRQMNEDVMAKSKEIKDQIFSGLQEDSIQSVLANLEKLFEYKLIFGKTLSDIESNFLQAERQIVHKFESTTSILAKINKHENYETILKCFENFKAFAEFHAKIISKKAVEILTIDIKKIDTVCSSLCKFLSEIQEKYFQTKSEYDFENFNSCMNSFSKWNSLLLNIKKYNAIYENEHLIKLNEVKDYNEILKDSSIFLNSLKNEIINLEFQSGNDILVNKFYENFFKKLHFLKQSKELKDHFTNKLLDYDIDSFEKTIIPSFITKFDAAVDTSKKIFQNSNLVQRDVVMFRMNYYNLLCFEKHSKTINLILKNYVTDIDNEIKKRVESIQKDSVAINCSIQTLAKSLIILKMFANNLPLQNDNLNAIIDKILMNFIDKHKTKGGFQLAQLSIELEKDSEGVGLTIISEHKIFKGRAISLFNDETQLHGIDYVLSKIDGDQIDSEILKSGYEYFYNTYEDLLRKHINEIKNDDEKLKTKLFDNLVRESKLIIAALRINRENENSYKWNESTRYNVLKLLSYLFAVWTLKNTEYYEQMIDTESRNSYLLRPHPSQIVSILRLLGIGYYELKEIKNGLATRAVHLISELNIMDKRETIQSPSNQLQNNLIEIGTGEGKSIIIAFTSCILALLGAEVSCVCYSEYLSSRDYESFKSLFEAFDIQQNIHYGTFNKICENILNELGDIRPRVANLIFNKEKESAPKSVKDETMCKILLIDEVDVFFKEDFYGNVYTPLAHLKDVTVNNLTNYLWNHRNEKINISSVELTSEYQACCRRFQGWELLIREATSAMIADLVDYKHDYIVHNDKIAYKEQDGFSYDVVYGYKTMFSYYYENETGRISESSLNDHIDIGIKCGNFSYAEIPSSFDFIIGVSGTLKSLSTAEKKIIDDFYYIKKNTYIPSVFGTNKRQFAKKSDVFIETNDDYFNKITDQINYKKDKRAILVYFDTNNSLMKFYNSKNIEPIKAEIQVLTEELFSLREEKETIIRRATTRGQITFLTKIFGRGIDFICRDANVNSNGGVHVIQTFFSEELSEEIQIMGRTARQGKDGSYNMILLENDLEKYLGVDYLKEIAEMKIMRNTYDVLNKKRDELFNKKYKIVTESVEEARKEHDLGRKFIQNLNNNKIDLVKEFLSKRNVGAVGMIESRTICLIDATGSMGNLLNQTKNTVVKMFERANTILKDYNIPSNSFQVQFAVYRDYDSRADALLQYSSWETNPDNLKKFIEGIKPQGGGDYPEAIEIGLWHANEESRKGILSQVILIGDAPAKSEKAIQNDRMAYHKESYWSTTSFKNMTFYKNEVEKLKEKKIPINAFYLHKGAELNFREMSSETGGHCEFLDINSKNGSEFLADVVTKTILLSVSKARGKEDELVNAYNKKFSKSYA